MVDLCIEWFANVLVGVLTNLCVCLLYVCMCVLGVLKVLLNVFGCIVCVVRVLFVCWF